MTAKMSKSTFIKPFTFAKAILASMVVSTSLSGHAGAVAGGASEWTQIANNIQLAIGAGEQARIVANTMLQYETQLKQYYNELKQLEKLTNIPRNTDEVSRRINEVSAYRNRLGQVQGSVDQQTSVIRKRMTEAQLAGLTWDEYAAREKDLVAKKNERAIERLKYEESVFRSVESDYQYAREIEPQINNANGVTGAMQIMNQQMNRLVTQNARLIESINVDKGEQRQKMEDEAKTRAEEMERDAYIRKVDQLRSQRQRGFYEGIGK